MTELLLSKTTTVNRCHLQLIERTGVSRGMVVEISRIETRGSRVNRKVLNILYYGFKSTKNYK